MLLKELPTGLGMDISTFLNQKLNKVFTPSLNGYMKGSLAYKEQSEYQNICPNKKSLGFNNIPNSHLCNKHQYMQH